MHREAIAAVLGISERRHVPRAWSPPNAISKSAMTFWRRKCARYWKGSPEGLAMGLR